jgi:hypothetical protein
MDFNANNFNINNFNENIIKNLEGGSIEDGSKDPRDEYRIQDELGKYKKMIEAFRAAHKDADDMFIKRDEAIDEYIDTLNKNGSKEHIRIAKARLDTLNSYINRLVIGYFKEKERSKKKIEDHYTDWYNGMKYKVNLESMKQYANSPFNDIACGFAKMGIPFVSQEIANELCIPRGPVSDCNLGDISQYQGVCYHKHTSDNYGKLSDNVFGPPQHLAWGEKELTQAKCTAGVATMGRQERAVCGLGYYMGTKPTDSDNTNSRYPKIDFSLDSNKKENTFNYTRCHLGTDEAAGTGGWADLGNLNHTCAVEAGNNVIRGIDLTANFYKTYGPPDLQFGLSKSPEGCVAHSDLRKTGTGQRGKCEIGKYYLDDNTIYEVQRNESQCVQPADLTVFNENRDMICRKQVGFGQGNISINQPSQHTFGMKQMYGINDKGCKLSQRRLKCEMGYANGKKLEPWSTDCVKRLDNMGDVCKKTYGDEWFPWPQKDSTWDQGCGLPATGTRATCRKDDMVPLNTVFTNVAYESAGQQCTTVGTVGLYDRDYACNADYGPNYTFNGYTQSVDVKYGELPPKSGNDRTTDYNNFSVSRDKCTGLMWRGKCKKTRELKDFKNSICLWTNRHCGGLSCKERCASAGKGWVALNEGKRCNKLEGGETPGCMCCTVNNYKDEKTGEIINKTDEYLAKDNPYYEAILDTQGIAGQSAYTWDLGIVKHVKSKDLYLCKHAAYSEDRPDEKSCVTDLTTDLKRAISNGKYVYTPINSDRKLMEKHLNTYRNMGGRDKGPNQMWFKNTSNHAWPSMYGWRTCGTHEKEDVKSCLIKRSDLSIWNSRNQKPPSGWSLADCKKGEFSWDLYANYWYSCDNPKNK